jgi:uncharacterized membrane protein (DUF485 family)
MSIMPRKPAQHPHERKPTRRDVLFSLPVGITFFVMAVVVYAYEGHWMALLVALYLGIAWPLAIFFPLFSEVMFL